MTILRMSFKTYINMLILLCWMNASHADCKCHSSDGSRVHSGLLFSFSLFSFSVTCCLSAGLFKGNASGNIWAAYHQTFLYFIVYLKAAHRTTGGGLVCAAAAVCGLQIWWQSLGDPWKTNWENCRAKKESPEMHDHCLNLSGKASV